jgi:selenide,water dikinase
LDPGDLQHVLSALPEISHPDILVDMRHSDDAGVLRLTNDIALVQTLDFFTPIVDDPYHFGRIAAANAFSDIYAMGAKPLTAMNIVCFPSKDFSQDILRNTLSGGHSIIQEAGAFLMGGHSVDDLEFKYGLSVTGVVHPEKIITNSRACPGDACILTKALGSGVLATALKGQLAQQDEIDSLIATTACLNKSAASVMKEFPISACTDITGFGLAGHLCEMAQASGVSIFIDSNRLPLIKQTVIEYANMGLVPAGTYANKSYYKQYIQIESGVARSFEDIFYDPQTSGGLLFCLPEKYAKDCIAELKLKKVNAGMIGVVKAQLKKHVYLK